MVQESCLPNRSVRCVAAGLLAAISLLHPFVRAAVDFPLPTINATFGTSQAALAGDFSGHGSMDVVTSDGDSSTNTTTLTLWENDGRGDFTLETTIDNVTLPGSFADTTVFLSTADFNHDGNADVLLFYVQSQQAQWIVYLGNSDGTFQAAKSGSTFTIPALAVPSQPPAYVLGSARPYAIGNLDGDDFPDIVAGNQVFIANGDGTFKSPTTFVGGGANTLLADFDGDGNLDVVGVSSGTLNFSKGNGAGAFENATAQSISGGDWAAVGDFNGDGKPDVVTSDGLSLSTLLNAGSGSFHSAISTPISSIVGATTCGNVCVVDLNGDGKDDVIVVGQVQTVVINTVSESTTPLYFLLSSGNGHFVSGGGLRPKGIALSNTYSASILTSDCNGDYRPDLLLSGSAFGEPIFATALGPSSNPAEKGELRVSVQPPGSGAITAGYLGASLRTLGAINTITAKPASGYLFSNWTGGVASSKSSLAFKMTPGLELVANFIGNPFIATQGTYYGVVTPSAGAPGPVKITISPLGGFTASLAFDGASYVFTGALNLSGAFVGSVGKSSVPVSLNLNLSGAGVLSGVVNGASFTAYHPAYAKGQAVTEVGKYTLLLNATTSGAAVPPGAGYGTMTVSATGGVTLVGKLPDGAAFTAAEPLMSNGNGKRQLVFYDGSLYANKGSLSGAFTFESLTDSDCDGVLQWSRPLEKTGSYYKAGFGTGVSLIGALYAAPKSGSSVLPFTATTDNGAVELSGGGLAQPINELITLTPLNAVVVSGANSEKLKITLDPATGTFSGSFIPSKAAPAISFGGVLYQNPTIPQAAGFFLGPVVSGTGEGGRFSLTPN